MIERLLNKHITNLRKLVFVFQQKHDLPDFEDLGITDTIVFFGDHYLFTIDNILYDLSTNQPKGLILEWFDSEFNTYDPTKRNVKINFYSYSMGLRNTKDLLKDAKTKLEITKKDFLNNLNNN